MKAFKVWAFGTVNAIVDANRAVVEDNGSLVFYDHSLEVVKAYAPGYWRTVEETHGPFPDGPVADPDWMAGLVRRVQKDVPEEGSCDCGCS